MLNNILNCIKVIDVNNFDNFTFDEYKDNLKRLNIQSHNELIGKTVFYSRKSYGEHKVLKWNSDKAEYLLEIDGHRFWSNPFRIII